MEELKRPWKIISKGAARFIETADGETLCQMVGPNRENKAIAILRDYDNAMGLLAALEEIAARPYALNDAESSIIRRIAGEAIAKAKEVP